MAGRCVGGGRHTMWAIVAALVGSVVVAGCGASTAPRTAPKKLVPLNIALPSGVVGLPVIVGARLGIFRRAGLAVDLSYTTSGSVAVDALYAGTTDIAVTAETPLIEAASKVKGVSIGIEQIGNGTSGVVVAKGITSLSQLRGKAIASTVGSETNSLLIDAILPRYGLQPGQYTLVNLPFTEMPAALAAHSIAAFAGNEPQISEAVAQGLGTELTTYRPYGYVPIFFLSTPAVLKAKRGALYKFITAYNAVVRVFNKSRSEAVSAAYAFLRSQGDNVTRAMVGHIVAEMVVASGYPSDLAAHLQRNAGALLASGKIAAIPQWSKVLLTPAEIERG